MSRGVCGCDEARVGGFVGVRKRELGVVVKMPRQAKLPLPLLLYTLRPFYRSMPLPLLLYTVRSLS